MMEPECSLLPGGDPPEEKQPPASTEDESQERVYGSDNTGVSDVTELKREETCKILDQVKEKASSLFKSSLGWEKIDEKFGYTIESLEKKEERLRVVEAREKEIGLLEETISGKLKEREMEFDFRHVTEASLVRFVVEKQIGEVVRQLKAEENKLVSLHHSKRKKLEGIMSEFDAKKADARRLFESIHEKLSELEKAEKGFDMKQRAENERLSEESKQIEARKNELSLLEEGIKEKSAELKIKEETFELKQKEEAEKWREETEKKSRDLEIKEKTLERMLKELEQKQMEFEDRSKQQPVKAETRKRSNLGFEPLVPLMGEKDSDAGSLTPLAKKHKSEANDGDIGGIVCCTEKSDETPKPLACLDTKFNDFSKSMSSFAVDQVWALRDPRDDMPRIYAQIRTVFSSHSSLQVTLLDHVQITKDENFIPNACGRFEYGDTEIKSHLMFAHEMDHTKCDQSVILYPREGETWALFRDWNTSWKSNSDLHEPPHRYDLVEVISEFDDEMGIAVAYMGRVEGFASVFNRAEKHGIIQMMISPGEMQMFSHKVASVELRGDEKEGVPAGAFELEPAATPRYDLLVEDCGSGKDQEGSTKDLAIIID